MKAISIFLLAGLLWAALLQPGLAAQRATANERVVYSFVGGNKDGDSPYSLTAFNRRFFGTTLDADFGRGGKVFKLNPENGKEKILHKFCRRDDCPSGWKPFGALVALNGTLYGTTAGGGTGCLDGCGTVYSIDPKTGTQTVLYSFCPQGKCPDGNSPVAGLIVANGKLYGTTAGGGSAQGGTVYAFDPATNAETVLYSFCKQANCTDGSAPYGGLTAMNGMLYGTTSAGGAHAEGEVFSLAPATGALAVVYSFCSQPNCADGSAPQTKLLAMNGMLYGTTANLVYDDGKVFSLDPATGIETVLYTFCAVANCADGEDPSSPLLAMKGTLYGMTFQGGANGAGEVYGINPATGAQSVIYSFCAELDCTDGAEAAGNLINTKGTLFGTTSIGGAVGYGTVFALQP